MNQAAQNLHRIVLAPFGRHTAYMLAGYLRHVFIVVSILLAIALTIDLWPQYQSVAAHGGDGLGAVWSVMRFSALRTPGLIAPLVPFATFIGVIWTEVIHTQSGERMLVWNSGRSPLQCLSPVLLLGLILGAADFAMDAWAGPASMGIQMQEQLGRDGTRLDRNKLSDESWMSLPDGLLKAEIAYGPPAVLHNVMYFRRNAAGQVLEVDVAKQAAQISGETWQFQGGQSWHSKTQHPAMGTASGQTMTPFETRLVRLKVDPLWLAWYDLAPQYIPLGVLHRLAASEDIPDAHGQYGTRFHIVLAGAVLPTAMALLAATLAMLFLAYRVPVPSLIGIAFAGYTAHFGTKAGLILGQNGYIAPVLAGWTVPVLIFAAAGAILFVIERQRRGKIVVSAG